MISATRQSFLKESDVLSEDFSASLPILTQALSAKLFRIFTIRYQDMKILRYLLQKTLKIARKWFKKRSGLSEKEKMFAH